MFTTIIVVVIFALILALTMIVNGKRPQRRCIILREEFYRKEKLARARREMRAQRALAFN